MEKNDFAVLIFLIFLNVSISIYGVRSGLFVDEGQYLLIAKKMLDGWVPYRDIIENKPLGMYLSLIPAVLLCGRDVVKLRVYGGLIFGFTSFFIFLIGKKLKNEKVGILSALIYVSTAAFPGFDGYFLITEPISNFFLSMLFYIMLFEKPTPKNLFLTGVLTAVSCSIRQTCIFVLIPVAWNLIAQKVELRKSLGWILCGVGVVLLPMLFYLIFNSALWDAFYWCFYVNTKTGFGGINGRLERLIIYLVFTLPLLLAAVLGGWRGKKMEVLWLWLIGSFTSAFIGYMWLHNFLFTFPPLSILAAVGIWNGGGLRCGNWKSNVLRGVAVFAVLYLSMLIILGINAMYHRDEEEGENQKKISEFIASHTDEDDGIFMFMTDTYIYYLSDRKPVTRMTFFWILYVWRIENVANEFIFEPLEKHKPKYVVMNPLIYENEPIVIALNQYLEEKYNYVNTWGYMRLYERKAEFS